MRSVFLLSIFLPLISFAQDSTINNLVHPNGYQISADSELQDVQTFGSKRRKALILIAGVGFDASVYREFVDHYKRKYQVIVVTLPGCGTTKAPAMPPTGTSYSAWTWHEAALNGILKEIKKRKLSKPIIVGHFNSSAHIAIALASRHPTLVDRVVVVGAEPFRLTPSRKDPSGKTPASIEERIKGVDMYWANWFKTVSKETWDKGAAQPIVLSTDSTRGQKYFRVAASVPVHVKVRYACEFFAIDASQQIETMQIPMLVVVPLFTQTTLESVKTLKPFFIESWRAFAGLRNITIKYVEDSGIFTWVDNQNATFDAIDKFLN